MSKTSNTTHKSLIRIGTVTAAVLAIPLVAMQFSEEWDWRLFDFVIIGILLAGTGLIYEFVIKKIKDTKHRLVFGLLLLLALLLVWAELAVGVFGSPFTGG